MMRCRGACLGLRGQRWRHTPASLPTPPIPHSTDRHTPRQTRRTTVHCVRACVRAFVCPFIDTPVFSLYFLFPSSDFPEAIIPNTHPRRCAWRHKTKKELQYFNSEKRARTEAHVLPMPSRSGEHDRRRVIPQMSGCILPLVLMAWICASPCMVRKKKKTFIQCECVTHRGSVVDCPPSLFFNVRVLSRCAAHVVCHRERHLIGIVVSIDVLLLISCSP
jgi:hypothetical protein